jgi:hypothetical protein
VRAAACGPTTSHLYQIQRLDPATDIEETLSALSDLIHKRGRLVIPTTLAATARS